MQYKAGTKCDNCISGPERKDGALGGYKVKTALKHWKTVNGDEKNYRLSDIIDGGAP